MLTDEWLSYAEAGRKAGVDRRTIRRWVDQGRIIARLTASGRPQVRADDLTADSLFHAKVDRILEGIDLRTPPPRRSR